MSKFNIPREFLGAFKKGHRKSAREFIDEELSVELLKKALAGCEESRKALEWVTKFNNEYHKAVIKKDDPTAFHSSDELREDCNRRSYLCKNDLYSHAPLIKKIDEF